MEQIGDIICTLSICENITVVAAHLRAMSSAR
jgi:hypothetical protein